MTADFEKLLHDLKEGYNLCDKECCEFTLTDEEIAHPYYNAKCNCHLCEDYRDNIAKNKQTKEEQIEFDELANEFISGGTE